MGNRAHVIFTDGETISPAIYLHWNGGPESVYAFLQELDLRGVRADAGYEAARFAQIVGEFFDGVGSAGGPKRSGLSLGVTNGPKRISSLALAPYDHGDNGVYVVCRKGPRSVRRFVSGDSGLRELAPDEVECERRSAFAHPYMKAHGIGEAFAVARGQVDGVS